ncbi:MAG: DegT/DnrJ/EryC1/StrS family aminotransferase [Synergistaceae bacterium]|jgi:8-amino-3,8-dideoxy-alpha-D-manno-octulosonate transaminase|nr:DegT/DnrJ/EryC1/StrS family aminotransferase [Synergistaceae bacterium]
MPGFELFDEDERRAVSEVMETGVLMRYGFAAERKGRWKAREMEAAICERAGVSHALLLANGTAALTTSLAALGVGAGDEVVMPTFTFTASFESIIAAGATPVLADVDDTLCMSLESASRAVTPRTKVIMPVHMCGAAADVAPLREFCQERGLFLVEDACQAFGAKYKGKSVGGIGDVGCYSFDFNKVVTCGEGGAVATNDAKVYERADMYHDHGHDHSNPDRGLEGHQFAGYNYRISELNAAIGCAQIRKTDKFITVLKRGKKAFRDALAQVDGVTFRRLPDADGDSATFLSFFMPTEALARAAAREMKAAGVEGVFHWYDNNWHYVRNWNHLKGHSFVHKLSSDVHLPESFDFSASDRWMSRCISISMKLGWREEDLPAKAANAAAAVKRALVG